MLLVHSEHKPTPDAQPRSLFDRCDEATRLDNRRFFPDMLAYMDKLIGNVVDRPEKHGLQEKTLVVVMGDSDTLCQVATRARLARLPRLAASP